MWTLFDSQGYIVKNAVEVRHYEDGTTRINATLHETANLIILDSRIESKLAGWYLER
jgi:hypothetical protein